MDLLNQLKAMTVVVADTGDVESIAKFKPQDATTNPSLILKASADERYQPYVLEAVNFAKTKSKDPEVQLRWALRKVAVNFGKAILALVPGRVSTEVDAHLSFDQEATIREAQALIELYVKEGIDPKRVLIKIAATYEGIMAAAALEKQGIHCNLTLMFNFAQARLCAEHGITLISPFVGRIYDWYKKREGRDFVGAEDPGVQSVRQIYNYYKKFDYPTIVMGASFRNIGQIKALAGCDYLTISPGLLQELQETESALPRELSVAAAKAQEIEAKAIDEAVFRASMAQDQMAQEKLTEGIELFCADLKKLEQKLAQLLV